MKNLTLQIYIIKLIKTKKNIKKVETHDVRLYCGEKGIRTLGTRKRSTVFETAPFDHSGISPRPIL